MTRGEHAVIVSCAGCGGRLELSNVRVVPQGDGTYTADLIDGPFTAWRVHARHGCAYTPRWGKVLAARSDHAMGGQ